MSWLTRSKNLLQVHVDHGPVAGLHVLLRFEHRVVRAAPRPEAVAVRAEARVDERLQHLQQRLLDQPVHDGRNPQLAHPATRLGYAHAAHRLGPVAAVEQPSSNVGPRALEIFARVLHRASIDAGASLVGLTRFHAATMFSLASACPSRSLAPQSVCACRASAASSLTASNAASPRPGHRAPRLARASDALPRRATCLVTVLLVRPFARVYGLGGLPSTTTASADFSLRLITVALSGMRRDLPR